MLSKPGIFFLIYVLLCSATPRLFVVAQKASSSSRTTQTKRPVTVADSIRMTNLGEPFSRTPVQFSPDRSCFFIILQKGNLENNSVEYSIVLFRTAEVFQSPKPDPLVTFASSSNRMGISQARWLANNRTITFLGEQPGKLPQVYALDVKTKRLKQLTNHAEEIRGYATTSGGERIIYNAEEPCEESLKRKNWKRGFVVTQEWPDGLISGNCKELFRFNPTRIYTKALRSNRFKRLDDKIYTGLTGSSISVSPDGEFAVIDDLMFDPPKHWRDYKDRSVQVYLQKPPGLAVTNLPMPRLMLVDLGRSTVKPLLDAPSPYPSPLLTWSPDSRFITLTNAWLPLSIVDPGERERRQSTRGSVLIRVADRQVERASTGALEVGAKPDTNAAGGGPIVTVDQDMNTPPQLYATDPKTKQRVLLMDLNPQFRELNFGHVEELKWKSKDGTEWNGGIYLPPGYMPGKRYPLVIQTHGFVRRVFLVDGTFTTAFAGQSLAGKDVMVLQMADNPRRETGVTPQEAPAFVAAVEAVIDLLKERGMIDSDRVGIVGFSRTVAHVEYLITHSNYKFAAVTVADGVDFSYLQYMVFRGASTYADPINGGAPFGEGLQAWLKNAPGFNLDKIHAPVRIEEFGLVSVLQGWETFSGLSRLAKPVEMIYFPDGGHPAVRPWERMASQQGSVDWFRFWLKDEEDRDAAKADQYARWRQMREKVELAKRERQTKKL
jgi:hypothetical protein